jgi:hypothetical protein
MTILALSILAVAIYSFGCFRGRAAGDREADLWQQEASAWANLYFESRIPDQRERIEVEGE